MFVTPTSIRFLATGMQAMIVKDAEAVAAARITGVGYDRVTEAFHRCAAHIPIVNVNAMIREERSGRDWSYRAAVLRRGSKANDNGVPREVGTSPFSS